MAHAAKLFSCSSKRLNPFVHHPLSSTTTVYVGKGCVPFRTIANASKSKKGRIKSSSSATSASAIEKRNNAVKLKKEKQRTRSDIKFVETLHNHYHKANTHIPVMLAEVLQVFAQNPLHSFVDCTLGAAGHSCAVHKQASDLSKPFSVACTIWDPEQIIQSHPELQLFVGLDVDPLAHEKAQDQIKSFLKKDSHTMPSDLKVHTHLKNFKDIKSVLGEVDDQLMIHGVDGILMDLGISSMQVGSAERGFSVLNDGPLDMRMDPMATLRAEDILNCWPEAEVGRILREYGEESNWHYLQTKIMKARLQGGLHSTGELVNIVRSTSPKSKGRQGWIKTATRVFQALRIAVNDELRTLENALYTCFDCLSSGGRLAVISFHSLEDRIVKQTFLDIICIDGEINSEEISLRWDNTNDEKELWIKKKIVGVNGAILTKRPITPSEQEEVLNPRSRSAKLRVIRKK